MFLLLFMNLALADDTRDVVYKKETVIDFEGIELEGELVKPQGSLVIERPKATFNPFITVRKDFDQEMMDSIKEIK